MTDGHLDLLAIDTATEACSAALVVDGEIEQRLEVTPNGHSGMLLGMVESLLKRRRIDLAHLDAIAVDAGPGSFTGLRIGIGVAQEPKTGAYILSPVRICLWQRLEHLFSGWGGLALTEALCWRLALQKQ